MIHFTKGDMFDIDVDIHINTVNCVGVMGAGVALAFKTRFPDMFIAYQEDCKNGQVRPGHMHIWKSQSQWIINFPTKRHWREKSRYEDISAGLADLRNYMNGLDGVRVAMPALGCGNGGLDWARVAPMISEAMQGLNAEIYVFEPADSIRLGRKRNQPSENEVMQDLEALGFRQFELNSDLVSNVNLRAQVKGNAELIVSRWIALYTSREIGVRESSALAAVAKELSLSLNPPTIAMIYQNSGTEEIAEVFLNHGLAVVLILPFSPRVKKRVGLSEAENRRITYAILSFSETSELKPSELDRYAEDVLRRGSSVLLFSDPEPERHLRGFKKNYELVPSFYLRYGVHSLESIHKIEKFGLRAIGRRADSGEPNLAPLYDYFSEVNSKEVKAATSPKKISVSSRKLKDLAAIIDKYEAVQSVQATFSLEDIPAEMRSEMEGILLEETKPAGVAS